MFQHLAAPVWRLVEQQALDVVLQSSGSNGLIIGGTGFVIGLFVVAAGIQSYRKGRLVSDTATETVRSVAVGQTELEGVARPLDEPSRQPFRDGPCLYAAWRVEEYRGLDDGSLGDSPLGDSPLGDSPLDDSSIGESGDDWETIGKGSYAEPFLLTDDTGEVVVDPDADTTWRLTDGCTTQWTFGGDADPGADAGAFDPSEAFSTETSNRRRYTQTVVSPGMELYAFGQAVPTDAGELPGHDLKVERDTASDRFLVSNMTEERLRSAYNLRGPLYVLAGVAICAASLYLGLWIAS